MMASTLNLGRVAFFTISKALKSKQHFVNKPLTKRFISTIRRGIKRSSSVFYGHYFIYKYSISGEFI